jgi:hypothetical protein
MKVLLSKELLALINSMDECEYNNELHLIRTENGIAIGLHDTGTFNDTLYKEVCTLDEWALNCNKTIGEI